MERTRKLYTKGNNSKSRRTRVTVYVYCMSSFGVQRLCEDSCKYVKCFLSYEADTKIVTTQRAITPKVGNPELRFMGSASRLMVFNVYVKIHENMSSGFKDMERTRKLYTKGNNSNSRRTGVTVHVLCMSSYGVQRLCEVS